MSRDRLISPTGDVSVAGSYETSNRNLGDCTKATYADIWEKYRDLYAPYYTERELRQRHIHWKKLASEVR